MIVKSFVIAKTFRPMARKSLRDHGMPWNLSAWIPRQGMHARMNVRLPVPVIASGARRATIASVHLPQKTLPFQFL